MYPSQPPPFPRPSSSLARSQLQNRLVYSGYNPRKIAKPAKKCTTNSEEVATSVSATQLDVAEKIGKNDKTVVVSQITNPLSTVPEPTTDTLDVPVSALTLEEPSLSMDTSFQMSLFLRNNSSIIPGAESLLHPHISLNQTDDLPIPSNYSTKVTTISTSTLTGAIEHILRGDIEYLYLQAAPHNPYSLSICANTEDIKKSNFIILSRYGITRYQDNDSEYVSFREYFNEYTAYHKIITLPTFGTLRLWKPFLLWKKYVNNHKRKRTINRLHANLFFLDSIYAPVVRSSFQALRKLVDCETKRLSHHLLYDINTTEVTPGTAAACTKDATLTEIIDRITIAGEQRALLVLTDMPTLLPIHSYHQMQNDASTYDASTSSYRRGVSLQGSEYSTLDADHHLSFTERASIRLHCRRTANMIRLFDFLFRDSLYEAVEAALKNFHEFLLAVQTNRSSARQLATLSIILQEDGASPSMELRPTRDELHSRLNQLLNETLASGCHMHSLLLHQQFTELLLPILNEITDITLIDRVFHNSKNSLHVLMSQCLELIVSDVNVCQTKVADYSYLIENYTRNVKRMNDISLELLQGLKPVEISQHLTEVLSELELYRTLPQYELCGVLRLEIRGVVRIAYTQLVAYKNLLCEKIPELFLSLGEHIYTDTHRVASMLGREVQDVDNFVKLVDVYNIAAANSAKLEEAYVYVLALKEVMEEHGIPSTDEIFGLNATIRSEFVKCTEAMSYFERNKEENTKIYKKELLSRVKLLQIPMEQITLRMSAELLLNPESNTDLVLEEIENLFSQLQDIVTQSNYVENCQRALDMNAFDVVQAGYTMKLLSSLHSLWLIICNINDLTTHIHSEPFTGINVAKISVVVKDATKTLQKVDKRENSRLEEWIQKFIDDMSHLVPLLKCLTSETILDRHKGQINAIVGFKLYQVDAVPPLHEIVDRNLVKHFDAIQQIHHQSQCEANLELLLRSLQSVCASKECVLQADSHNKASMRIQNISECVDMLEDVTIRVKSALQSKHVDCIRSEYNDLLAKVQEWSQLCTRIQDLQRTNAEYKILFTSSRTARYIHTALRYFNITDDVWRVIIKTLRADCRLSALFERQKLAQMLDKAAEAMDKVNETVDKFVEEQCSVYPKFHLLPRQVLYDVLETSDLPLMLTKTKGLLLPSISSFVMDTSDVQQIRGVTSNSETLEFHSEISSRSNLGTWLKGVEAAMSERLQADIHELVTDSRQIIEDSRNGYCCCQSRLVAYQVKFWTALQISLHPDKMSTRGKSLRLHQLEINDHITMLTTILSGAKTSHHILSLANLLLMASYCRDVLQKICDEVDFAQNSFHIVDAAIRKYYNSSNNSIDVQHFHVKSTYGMQYLGLLQQVAITPLTEKVYMSLASATHSGLVPHLMGAKGSGKVLMLKHFMTEYGRYLHVVDCQYASHESMQAAVVASVSAGLRLAFTNAETLDTPQLSHLVSLITAAQQAGLLFSSTTTIGSVTIAPQNVSATAGSMFICMNTRQLSDIPAMPASLRQKFRPILLHVPSYHTILALTMAAYGYTDAHRSALRLIAFLEHVHCHAEIELTLMMKLVLSRCIPLVAEEINKQNMRDIFMQLYTTVKCLFQSLPRALHKNLDMINIQTACGLYMGVAMNIDIDRIDFKPQDHDPVSSIATAVNTSGHVLVVGDVGVGKSTAIRAALRSLTRKDRRSEEWPSKLYPQIINPTLLSYSTHDATALYSIFEDFMKQEKYAYLHIDVPTSSLFDQYYAITLQYDRHFVGKICWEVLNTKDCDPRLLTAVPIVYVDSAQYNQDTIIDAEIAKFCAKFNGKLSIAKDMKKCVSLFMRPMLQAIDASPYKSKDALVITAFHLLTALSTAAEVSEKTYDTVSLQRLVFYACLWSFGMCSTTSMFIVTTWFTDYIDRCLSTEKNIFPPSSQIFDYVLQPVEDSNELRWVHWKESDIYNIQVQLFTQTPQKPRGYYSDHSLDMPRILLPSKVSIAAAYMQRGMCITGGSLCITGELGSGKSSILQILSVDNANHRWSATIADAAAARVAKHLQHAHHAQQTWILERGIRDRGSIFIDDVNMSIEQASGDTLGIELYHSLVTQGGFYTPNTVHWKSLDQLYLVLAGSPRTHVVNKRVMRNSTVLHLSGSDNYLSHILTAKFSSVCPFVKEALASDIVSISLRLFDSLKIDDSCVDIVAASVPRVSPTTAVAHLLESVQVYVNNHAVVSSSDIVQAWKKVLVGIAASPDYEKVIFNRLDALALGVTFATPNFRAMMTKGSVLKRDILRLPTMLRRKSDAPITSDEVPQDVKVKSIGLMDMLELRRVVLSHAEKKWESVLDASNPKLWRDIQKIALFFITPNKYAMLPDCMAETSDTLIRLACDLCSATYHRLPISYTEIISTIIELFLSQLSRIVYKSAPKSVEPKQWAKQYRTVLRDLDRLTDTMVYPTHVWHLHAPNTVNWAEFHSIFTMNHPQIYDALEEIWGTALYTQKMLHNALGSFAASQKVILTVNSHSETVDSMLQCPFVIPHMRCVYLTKTYGLNVDVLGLFFNESDVDSISSRLREVINVMSIHADITDDAKHHISTVEYTQGTYDMIIQMLQFADNSDGKCFSSREALLRNKISPATDDNWALASDVIYAVLFSRYISCFVSAKQVDMDLWLKQQLELAALFPKMSCLDVATMCYSFYANDLSLLPILSIARSCAFDSSLFVILSSAALQFVVCGHMCIAGDGLQTFLFLFRQYIKYSSTETFTVCYASASTPRISSSSGIVYVSTCAYEITVAYLLEHGHTDDKHLLQSWDNIKDHVRQLCLGESTDADFEMHHEDVTGYVKDHFSKAHYICDTLSHLLSAIDTITQNLLSFCFDTIETTISQQTEFSIIRTMQAVIKSVYLYVKAFVSREELQVVELLVAVKCAGGHVGNHNTTAMCHELRALFTTYKGIRGLSRHLELYSVTSSTKNMLDSATVILTRYGLSSCDLSTYVHENIETFVAWMSDAVNIQWYPKTLTVINWLEQVVVAAALKPVTLQSMIHFAIDNYGKWSINKLENSSAAHIVPSTTQSDRVVLLLRNDEWVDASIVAMDVMKKGFFEVTLLRVWPGALDAVPAYIFPQSAQRRDSMINPAGSVSFNAGFTLTRLDSGPAPRAVDILNFTSISRSNTIRAQTPQYQPDTGLLHVVTKQVDNELLTEVCNLLDDTIIEFCNVLMPSMLWQHTTANTISNSIIISRNFASILAHSMRVLAHFLEMQDVDCDMQASRLLVLTSLFHAAVMCRTPPACALGDDTLLHALGFVAHLIASREQIIMNHLLFMALYLYAAPTINDNFKCVIMALFEQYFSRETLNFMEDYRMAPLDVLAPDLLSIDALESCIQSIHCESHDNCSEATGIAYGEWCNAEYARFASSWPTPTVDMKSHCRLPHLQRVKSISDKLLSLLPIPLDHQEKEAARVAKQSVKNTSSQIRQLSMQRNPGNVSVRRVQRQSSGLFSRSFTEEDPMWRYCILECQCFNANLEVLREYLTVGIWNAKEDVLEVLERSEFPLSWLQMDMEEKLSGYVTFEEYIMTLKERRQMLSHWLNTATPGTLKLHLLHNPHGLLHALREISARSLNTAIESIQWDCSFINMQQVSHNELTSLTGKGGDAMTGIIIGGLQLQNAEWNFETNLLNAASTMLCGTECQDAFIKISAVTEKESLGDEYICPLFVARDLQRTSPLVPGHHSPCEVVSPLLHISLPCVEAEECMLHNVSLHAYCFWKNLKREGKV